MLRRGSKNRGRASPLGGLGIILGVLLASQTFAQVRGWSCRIHTPPNPYAFHKEDLEKLMWIDIKNKEKETTPVYLHGEIKKDEKLVARGNSNKIDIPPGGKKITRRDITKLSNEWWDKGLEKTLLRAPRLPEGKYEACVYVYKWNTKELLTKCCIFIESRAKISPPKLIRPMDGAILKEEEKYPFFEWIPPQPEPPGVTYELKIVEIHKGESKEAAMRNPAFFEKKEVRTPSLQSPELQKDKSYAWQIVAFSNQKEIAQSEIWQFSFKPPEELPTEEPPEISIPKVYAKLPLNTSVHGRLCYEFAGPGEYAIWSLKNTRVKLVVKYVLKMPPKPKYLVIGEPPPPYQEEKVVPCNAWGFSSVFQNCDRVLGVTTTDDNGEFSFSFLSADSMGLVAKDTTIAFGTHYEFPDTKTGDLYRIACLIVDSPYYCSPNKNVANEDIIVQPGENKDIGKLIAYVRSYSLTVTTAGDTWPWQKAAEVYKLGPLDGVLVYLLRKTRPQGVPVNEGHPRPDPPETKKGMEVIAKGKTDKDGKVTFKRLVKNIGPNDEYYIYAETDPESEYNFFQLSGPKSYQFPHSGDYAVFNYEYQHPSPSTEVKLYPLDPCISGYVYRADNPNIPVQGAKVKLMALAVMIPLTEAEILTSEKGGFIFDHLTPQYDEYGQWNGLLRWLHISKDGYKDKERKNLPFLKWGQRHFIPKILLEPAFWVHGKIVNEGGQGVPSKVRIGEGSTVQAQTSCYIVRGDGVSCPPASFESPAVSGKQTLIIDPDNDMFFPETIEVNITKDNQDLGTFVVYMKKHRVQIRVVEGVPPKPGMLIAEAPPIQEAYVEIVDRSPVLKTNTAGIVYYEFVSAADSFTIKVTAPDDQDYEGKTISAEIPCSKDTTFITVYLKKAAYISGKVYVGKDIPVPEARVFLSGTDIQTFTCCGRGQKRLKGKYQIGEYVLHNVPIGNKLIFKAVKSSKDTTFVGDSVIIDVPSEGVENVDFHLTVYEDMDITKLLGFPIEIEALTQTQEVKITGAFVYLPENSQFRVKDTTTRLPFNQVSIKPSDATNEKGVPLAVPTTVPVTADSNSVALKLYDVFSSQLSDKKGVKVDTQKTVESGVVKGKVSVYGGQFQVYNLKFNSFHLALPNVSKGKLTILAITASGQDPVDAPKGFLVVDSSGDAFEYRLCEGEFDAVTDPQQSFVHGDSVCLVTTLHSDIGHLDPPDINLKIGTVVLHTDKWGPVIGTEPISIPMEKWSLVSNDWSITDVYGFVIHTGQVETGIVDVPFTGMKITPTQLLYGDFTLDSLTLAGVIPLTVTGETYFGWDPGKGHWSLSVAPKAGSNYCAYLSDLPGMEQGDRIRFDNCYLLSDGGNGFTIDQYSPELTIHKVTSFYPSGFKAEPDYIKVLGMIDLHMPLVSIQPTALRYFKGSNNDIAFELQSFTFGWAMYQKGNEVVALSFPGTPQYPQKLDEEGFRARGTVYEEYEGETVFSFDVNLYRTVSSISIWIEGDPNTPDPEVPKEPHQSFDITKDGKRKLIKVTGGMHVMGNDWTDLKFAGDLWGTEGAEGRLEFTVSGDIECSDQEVGVKNIDTPFGNLGLTYEFPNRRFVGNLDYDIDLEVAQITCMAQVVIGAQGWYFLQGGSMKMKDPDVEATVALLIGDHPMTQEIRNIFIPYSKVYEFKGDLPATFPKIGEYISGFFFEGGAMLGLQSIIGLPELAIDLVVVEAELWVDAGADMRMGMNFASSGQPYSVYSVGTDILFDAGFKLGASGIFVCGGACFGIKYDMGWDGQFKSDGEWFMDMHSDMTLYGKAYAGGGLACDSGCEGICACDAWGGSVTFGINGHMGSDGKWINFTCSDKGGEESEDAPCDCGS